MTTNLATRPVYDYTAPTRPQTRPRLRTDLPIANGFVKFYNEDKGYGFIQRPCGGDIFFHAQELTKAGLDASDIRVGTRLTCTYDRNPRGKGDRAVDLMLTEDMDTSYVG